MKIILILMIITMFGTIEIEAEGFTSLQQCRDVAEKMLEESSVISATCNIRFEDRGR